MAKMIQLFAAVLILFGGHSMAQQRSTGNSLDLLVSNGQNCPEGCRCDEALREVTCRNVDFSLGDFYRLPPWTKTLTLSRASIPTLFDRSFVTLRNLTSLTIQNSDLQEVQPNALLALNQLETLQLPFNQLTEIPSSFFANTPNLRSLSLADNLITRLPAGLFEHCHQLRQLRLDQNSIRSLPGASFAKLAFLEELHLSSNLLQELPASFITSASLKTIDVSFNAIRFVSPDALITLPELNFINLSHNLLTHLNPVSLISARKLNRVGLDHNPLICDCQLAPLRAYWTSIFSNPIALTESSGQSNYQNSPPTCAWPQQFNGIALDKLNPTDFICTTTTTTTSTTTTTKTPETTTTTSVKTTHMPIWLLNKNDSVLFGQQPSFEASSVDVESNPEASSSFMPPVEVIAASVAAVVALMLTLSIVLAILCYKRQRTSRRPRHQQRSISVSTTPKRFQVNLGETLKPGPYFTTSTPCTLVGQSNSRSSDVEKLGTDLLSSASSSSSGSASPPSGSTSIPSSSHNCIYSTQQSGAMVTGPTFQMMPDGGLAMIGTNGGAGGGLVQTVIDHLDYTSGVLIGAPHAFTLTRHQYTPSGLDQGNIVVDVSGLVPQIANHGNTMVRSESLV